MSQTATIPPGRAAGARLRSFLTVALRADRPRARPLRVCLDGLDELRVVRSERFEPGILEPGVLELRIDDGTLSSAHCRLERADDVWILEDARSKNGTLVNGRRVERAELSDGDLVEVGSTFLVFRECETDAPDAPFQPDGGEPLGLATMHPGLADLLASLKRMAASSLPILVRGETGTGKELIARAVHQLSARPGELIAVNCASIPPELLHAELFGSRRGAYSGATSDREGLVRAADRGTLFLDEIAELPAASQVTLLRFLEDRQVVPLGSTRAIPVDVRFVAATHADVEANGFRADLLARLAGFTLALPPLRERREDLGLLVARFLDEAGADPSASLSLPAARQLLAARWPLNIRQLRHAILAAALVSSRIEELAVETPPPSVEASGPRASATAGELAALLRAHRGNVSAVARSLETSRTQVVRLMQRYGLDASGSKSRA